MTVLPIYIYCLLFCLHHSLKSRSLLYANVYISITLPIIKDLLAACNLINYIGKQEKIEQIEIAPVILKKGETQLCLYSLGSMRDERLNRMWNNKKVRFLRPQQDIENDKDNHIDDEDGDSIENEGFFNIFTLHQNRDLGRGSKNCVHETMIPEWMDLVVWGHEHECVIELSESLVGTYRITQPGSSVATSLVPGEAARKKVGILDIMGKQFRMHTVPLTQVRPFVTAEMSLQEHREGLDPDDPHVDEQVTNLLQEEVKVMVCGAQDKRQEILELARKHGNNAGDDDSPLTYKLEKPGEPLIRIRVEHTGFSTLSNQRFGAHFVGQVANPEDILLFHRRKDPSKSAATRKAKVTSSGPIAPEVLEKTDMDDLINGLLEGPDTQLKLFNEKLLAEAMENFVDKKVTTSLDEVADGMLNKRQKALIMRKTDPDEEGQNPEKRNDSVADESMETEKSPTEETARSKSQNSTRRQLNTSTDDLLVEAEKEDHGPSDDDFGNEIANRASSSNRQKKKRSRSSDETEAKRTSKRASNPTKAKPNRSKSGEWVSSQLSFVEDPKRKAARRKALDDISDVDEIDLNAPSKTKSTRRNARGKRVNYSIGDDDDESLDDDPEVVSVVDDEDDDLMDDDGDSPRRKKKRKSVTTASRSRAKKAPAKATTPRQKSRATAKDKFDDSDDEGDYDNSMDLDEDWGTAKTRSQF